MGTSVITSPMSPPSLPILVSYNLFGVLFCLYYDNLYSRLNIDLEYFFQVWLPNRSISGGLEPVLSHTEKSCIVSYYRQFSANIKINSLYFTIFLGKIFGPSGPIKLKKNFNFSFYYPQKAVYNTMRYITIIHRYWKLAKLWSKN